MSALPDIRENKTVELIGYLFGRPIYVDPFRSEGERDHYRKRLKSLFPGPPEDEEELADDR